MHEFGIFIGRFSPFHLGHLTILKEGFNIAKKIVIVIGSHNRARNIKNPWSTDERIAMIKSSLSEEELSRVIFVPIKDYLYNDDLWLIDMQNKISEITDDSEDIAMIGYVSDASSYYLNLFPKWKFYSCPTKHKFHAAEVRNLLFTLDNQFTKYVHPNVAEYLKTWISGAHFGRLKEEYNFLADYKEKWRGAPFPPTFCTVDACVFKSGHVLLVRRKGKLGQGLLALPGGFLNQDENILDGAIRELKEETVIQLSKDELKNAVVDQHVFDFPERSLRGRTLTFAFKINLGSGPLNKVKGNDDSDKSFWLPLNEALQREEEFFEDHYFIIQHFLNQGLKK